jgi:enamine deaminase RidA (YjgF/YER057c/UK114 family)
MSAEARLKQLGITLPTAGRPMAKYKMAVRVGNMIYLSGHGPVKISDTTPLKGRCGQDLNLEQGRECARAVGLNMLATLRDQLGSLDKVKRLVKTLGLVNSTDDFFDHPKVINGYSELMADVFGEDNGVGARSAIGTNALPGNIPVEIEAIFEVE